MLRALARTAIDDPSRSYLASCRLPTKTCERTCARCLAAAIDGANLPNFFFWCHQIDREMLFLFNLIRMGVDGSFLVQHCCCCCRRLTDYCFGTFRFSQNSRKLFFPFSEGCVCRPPSTLVLLLEQHMFPVAGPRGYQTMKPTTTVGTPPHKSIQ